MRELRRDFASCKPFRSALYDRRFSDTGFTDEDRIVLGAADENLHNPLNLIIPPDDRIELSFFGEFRQIPAVACQGRRCFLRAAFTFLIPAFSGGRRQAVPVRVFLDHLHRLIHGFSEIHIAAVQKIGSHAVIGLEHAQPQVLGGHIALPHAVGINHRRLDDFLGSRRHFHMHRAFCQFRAFEMHLGKHILCLVIRDMLLDFRRQPVIFRKQAQEQVLRADILCTDFSSFAARRGQYPLRSFGKASKNWHSTSCISVSVLPRVYSSAPSSSRIRLLLTTFRSASSRCFSV